MTSAPDDPHARALVELALQRDPEERDAYLDLACKDRPELRAAAALLLTAETTALSPAAGWRVAAESSLAGRVVGPYVVRQELGRGGMGVVYLADDTRLSRRVALKALPRSASRDPSRRERLRHEARAAAMLVHPGIATVYALDEIDDDLYIATEYVPGQTLRAMLGSGPLSLVLAADIALQLARALNAAHVQGVVHRDLKPENAIRTAAGVVKILDFGLAKVEALTPSRLTDTGVVVGTASYMSPEQVRGELIDFRSDLFAFGIVLYEMISGTNPFEADTTTATVARILEVDPPVLSAPWRGNMPALDRIVATCLRKQARDRYASTSDLVADLERLQVEAAGRRSRLDFRPAAPAPQPSTRVAWWQFHQAAVAAMDASMIAVAWHVRGWLPDPWDRVFLLTALASAAVAASVRLHLLFTSRVYPSELSQQRGDVRIWTGAADAGFATALVGAALAIGGAHPEFAMLLLVVAIVTLVALLVIEPATARAAFPSNEP